MSTKVESAVAEALLPVTLGKDKISYAQGMRAGNWVFATGQMGQDFQTGIPADVLSERLPYGAAPKQEKEAERLFQNMGAVFAAGGTDFSHVVRLDQFYSSVEAVHPYHMMRFKHLKDRVPASTSILVPKLLLPDAEIDTQAVAIVPDGATTIEVESDPASNVPPSSGYSPAVRFGDYVFPSGATASAPRGAEHRSGLAMEATMPEWARWRGQPIALETEFVLHTKVGQILESVGTSLKNVVKGQAYLSHPEDAAIFNRTWAKIFADSPAALTIIPCQDPVFALREARTEINLIVLAEGAATKKEVIEAEIFTGFSDQPAAVRAGDMLYLSGLMAADEDGLVAEARLDPRQPHFGSPVRAQAECIIEKADRICAAAGARLENVVRIQQFHTDIAQFRAVIAAWRARLPDRPLPFSAVQISPHLPIPGATVLMDLWVYAP